MENFYDIHKCERSLDEWKYFLNKLLSELESYLSIKLDVCSYSIEEHLKDEAAYFCHVDFRGYLSTPLKIEACGILCYSVNWEESVSIGAYILLFQNGERLLPETNGSVIYLSRETNNWSTPFIETGDNDEWTRYTDTSRWDIT